MKDTAACTKLSMIECKSIFPLRNEVKARDSNTLANVDEMIDCILKFVMAN